jgi:hypothetical protein
MLPDRQALIEKVNPELEANLISRHAVTPEQVFSHKESPNAQEQEEEVRKALLPSKLAIPVGHTTRAVRLLMWLVVQNLIREKLKKEGVTNLELYIKYLNITKNKHSIRGSSLENSCLGVLLSTRYSKIK